MNWAGVDGLFRRYSSSVFRRARAILGDRDAAKDVMQDVFLRATRAQAEFSNTASPIAWLYRVTTNLCLKRLRDSARRRRILTTALRVPEPPPDLPVDTALTVHALLRELPQDLQEIAIYYFVDNMSQEEIAVLVGLPRRTVSSRLEQFRSRARRGELAS